MRHKAEKLSDVLETFDANAAAVREAMERIDEKALERPWTLRQGDEVMFTASRAFVLRVWCLSHMIHHRAQLCVYLRQLGLPVPAIYFNSADEPEWRFT
jgi:uncharacterized damage-inducible protein DinB